MWEVYACRTVPRTRCTAFSNVYQRAQSSTGSRLDPQLIAELKAEGKARGVPYQVLCSWSRASNASSGRLILGAATSMHPVASELPAGPGADGWSQGC